MKSTSDETIICETGVIHGRFQVLHNDHLKYLLSGAELCRHLVVGVTNPEPLQTCYEESDPHRNDPRANPLSYYERYCLIRNALMEAGISPAHFSIVPFPVNIPKLIPNYVPVDAVFFLSIYDDWGREKLRRFEKMGLRTHVLRNVSHTQKGLSSTDIRRLIVEGKPWEDLVPPSTARLLNAWDIKARLSRLGA